MLLCCAALCCVVCHGPPGIRCGTLQQGLFACICWAPWVSMLAAACMSVAPTHGAKPVTNRRHDCCACLQGMGENVLAAIQEYTRVLASDPATPQASDKGGSVYFDFWGRAMVSGGAVYLHSCCLQTNCSVCFDVWGRAIPVLVGLLILGWAVWLLNPVF